MSIRTFTLIALTVAVLVAAPIAARAQTGADATAALSWVTPESTLAKLAAKPLAPGEASPLPPDDIEMPRAGQNNAYGLKVTPDMQAAYDAFLGGDSASALAAIDRMDKAAGDDTILAWHLSALRAQVLIAAGRAADAERELRKTTARERAAFGRDVFSRALEGEALVWIGDYDRAAAVLAPVAEELQDWRLPTSYTAPPPNIPELVYVTTAQLRAYTALAGQFLLRGRISEALAWAERAETLFADVHFVSNHPLYGIFVSVHADSYYGRAINLSFLGAAKTVASQDLQAGAADMTRADAFYNALGYRPGRITTQALRAWSALAIEDFDRADAEAARAVEMALDAGQADMIWRVQALRGEALLADGQAEKAEQVLRSAEAAVDAVSGSLASDRAKRRFGVGKSDITYRLASFDIARGDLEQLFIDLERGRARAFVDMLAGVQIGAARDDPDVQRIRSIDNEVRALRLAASTRAEPEPARIKDLLKKRGAHLSALAERAPELAETLGVRVSALADIRKALSPGDILVYGVPGRGDDPVRLLMIGTSQLRLLETAATVRTLTTQLETLREAVGSGDTDGQSATGTALARALKSSAWPEAARYLVVPSGPLFFVPWGMVSEDRPVIVLPNAGWVRRADASSDTPDSSVVVGDPAFGGLLPQLAGAAAEARSVAALYHTDALSGSAATERAVRDAVGSATDILHLATHGRFEPAYPLRSALYLSDKSGKATAVTARDLFRSPLRARFVVLSACETGAGRAVAGDDFLGLVRSFYLGGSAGVVNSLWPVDDAGTKVFMETFHRNLSNGAGAAWLAARNATRNAGFPPAVYGAFVLGGAMD